MTELAKWRRSRGWSQQKVAKDLGYGKKWTTYAAQERGENAMPGPSVEKLRAMGFAGKLPREELEQPEPVMAGVTPEIFYREIGKLEERIEKLGEALRELQRQGQPQFRQAAPGR